MTDLSVRPFGVASYPLTWREREWVREMQEYLHCVKLCRSCHLCQSIEAFYDGDLCYTCDVQNKADRLRRGQLRAQGEPRRTAAGYRRVAKELAVGRAWR